MSHYSRYDETRYNCKIPFYQKLQTKTLFWKKLCFKLHAVDVCASLSLHAARTSKLYLYGKTVAFSWGHARKWRCALCISEESKKRLTALWAVGRFLPWWASSPAWQRRLDVIRVHTLSAVWGCVKWPLLLPKAWTVIVYVHRACEISKKGLAAQTARPAHSVLWCHLPAPCWFFQMFGGFFFFIHPPVTAEGCRHVSNEKILLGSLSRRVTTVWKKASEKYDRSCKADQLLPIDNLQNPLLLADSAK